jgi:hypothetical protein
MEGVRKVQAKMEGVAKVHAVRIQALPSAHIERTFIQRYTRHTHRRTGRGGWRRLDDLARERGDGGNKQERTGAGRQGRPLPVVAAAQQRLYLDARWHVGCWPCPPELYLTTKHRTTRQHTAKGQTQVRHSARLQSGALETRHSRTASRAPPRSPPSPGPPPEEFCISDRPRFILGTLA